MLSAMVRSENDRRRCALDVAPNLIHSSPKPVWIPLAIIEVEHASARLIADAVQQLAARPHGLD